jgi:hypothetical protein
MKKMRKRTISGIYAGIFACISLAAQAQYVSKVFEFLPAPGQFTNENIGRRASVDNVIGNSANMVSLGSFGGYIVVGFDQPIVNDPRNPYGVDFSIKGNSFAGNAYGQWCEPGAVQVMKDLNRDGLPNDGEWYELAGSDYYLSTTQRNVTVTYYNPHYSAGYAVPWAADNGTYGALVVNRFHQHPYYPDPFDFDEYPIRDSISFTGNKIRGTVNMSAPSYLNPHRAPAFGYCDSKGNNDPLTNPRNPYTDGTDGFDLSWAVDRDGSPVELDTAHFVRIYNAGFANIGWLGEWSTEVLAVGITAPDPSYVPQDYYRHYIGITQLHVLKGHSCRYDGILFKNGRPQTDGTPHWWTSDPEIAVVDNAGNLSALEPGDIWLYFSQKDGITPDSVPVSIVELENVILEMEGNSPISSDSASLFINEKIYIIGECGDSRTATLNGSRANRFIYEPLSWTSSRPEVGTIDNGLFCGIAPGRTMVYAAATSQPDLKDSILIIVKPIPEVQPIKKQIQIPTFKPQGSYKPTELFTTGSDAEIILNSVASNPGAAAPGIEKNNFTYNFTPDKYTSDTVLFNLTVFGGEHEFDLIFNYMPAIRNAGKQLLYTFVDTLNQVQAIKYYLPASGETGTLAEFQPETVRDMQVDGAYLFLATDKKLYRYNLSTGELENTLTPPFAPEKTLVVANRLFVSGKQDGQPKLLACYKTDLSSAETIDLPDELTAMTAFGDNVYALLNGADNSTMAVVSAGTNAVALAKTLDWGRDGLNVTDLVAKGNQLFAVRKKSDAASAAVISFLPADETRTVTESLDVEYQPFNTSAIIEPVNGDVLVLKNRRGFTEFNTATLTLGSSTFMRDNARYAAGAVYDPVDGKFYVAHTGASGSKGTVFAANDYSFESNFEGLGHVPACLRFAPELSVNDRPDVNTPLSAASIVERKASAVVTINKTNFADVENNFRIYPKSPHPFLAWERAGENLRYSAFFDGQVSEDSTVTVEIEAIDHYGCAASASFDLTIMPRIYTPRISTPLLDQTVAADADVLELSLGETFEFFDANVPAENVKTLLANSNPALVTANLETNNDLLRLSFAPGRKGTATITVRGATVESSPDDPQQPESKFVDAVFTVTVGTGVTGLAKPTAGRLQVYPTLTHGNITVVLDEAQPVAIFNATGLPVKLFQAKPGANSIDLSSLPNGLYLIKTLSATAKTIKN